jgi:predicted site-specific integrase-resolvase
MQVSLSEAAKMVGITRSTLYAHIREKGISVIDAKTKRPKIDVSELVRVYGDKVTPLDQITASRASKIAEGEQSLATEVVVLRERLKTAELERERERRQLSEQIENLQELLKKEQEVVGKVTAQLTDQRSSAEKYAGKEEDQAKRFSEIETTIKTLLELQQRTPKLFWPFRSYKSR